MYGCVCGEMGGGGGKGGGGKPSSGLPLSKKILLEAKKLGFSDKQIAVALAQTEVNVRAFREEHGEGGGEGIGYREVVTCVGLEVREEKDRLF